MSDKPNLTRCILSLTTLVVLAMGVFIVSCVPVSKPEVGFSSPLNMTATMTSQSALASPTSSPTPICNPPWPTPPSEACPWIASPTPTSTSAVPTPTPFELPEPPVQTPTPLPLSQVADSPAGTLFFVALSTPGVIPSEPQLLYAQIDAQGKFANLPQPFIWTPRADNRMVVGRTSISPDGTYLASIYETEVGESVIVVDITARQEMAYVWGGKFLNWHPNGREFLFIQQTETDLGLWLVTADTGQYRLLSQAADSAAISPDGQILAYADDISGIWLSNTNGSQPRQVSDFGATVFAWSPDSRYLLYGEYPSGGDRTDTPPPLPHLWLMNRAGAEKRLLNSSWESGITFAAHQHPVWSPTGRYIAHSSPLDPGFSYWQEKEDHRNDPLYAFRNTGVYVEDVQTGELWLVAQNALDATWSPDGSLLAVSKMDENEQVDIWLISLVSRDLLRATNTPELDRYPFWLPSPQNNGR